MFKKVSANLNCCPGLFFKFVPALLLYGQGNIVGEYRNVPMFNVYQIVSVQRNIANAMTYSESRLLMLDCWIMYMAKNVYTIGTMRWNQRSLRIHESGNVWLGSLNQYHRAVRTNQLVRIP